MRSLRILYLSAYWPRSHPTCGGEWRTLGIGRALRSIGTVDTIVVRGSSNEVHANGATNELPVSRAIETKSQIQPGLRRTINWAINPGIRFPYGVGVDAEANTFVERTLEDYDLVWLGNFRTPNMFKNWLWERSVLDIDDLPSWVERSKLKIASGLQAQLLQTIRINSWKRREQALADRFTVLVSCSASDQAYLRRIGCSQPVHVIPNGFERPIAEPVRRSQAPPRIGFIGPFSHPPNLDGIRWFAEASWPLIKRIVPDARLRIIGKGSDGDLKPAGPDIDGLGWVPDLAAEVGTWSLMIVPIRLGAGTRVKIAQAFSLKCPVVSTSFGAYGYDVEDQRDLLFADTAANFADACARLILHPDDAAAMADRVWERFLREWSWDAVTPRVWAAVEECLRLSAPVKR